VPYLFDNFGELETAEGILNMDIEDITERADEIEEKAVENKDQLIDKITKISPDTVGSRKDSRMKIESGDSFQQIFLNNSQDSAQCSVCNAKTPAVEEANIILGGNMGSFDSLDFEGTHQKICTRCGIACYLRLRVTGCQYYSAQNKYKPLPNRFTTVIAENLDIDLASYLNPVLELSKRANTYDEIDSVVEELSEENSLNDIDNLDDYLESAATENAVPPTIHESFSKAEDNIEQVSLGTTNFTVINIPTPLIRNNSGDIDLDFFSKKLMANPIFMLTTLGYIAELAEDTDFYYLTTPTEAEKDKGNLHTPQASLESSEFYEFYETITEVVWDLWGRARGQKNKFDQNLMQAEKLEKQPLLELNQYIRQVYNIVGEGGAPDEQLVYAESADERIRRYRNAWNRMKNSIDNNKVSYVSKNNIDIEFVQNLSYKLFDTLNRLHIIGAGLSENPATYEKYPRLLNRHIKKYGNVESGYRSWESKLLHDVEIGKSDAKAALEELSTYILSNEEKVEENIDYMARTSLSWAFDYIYPFKQIGEELRGGDLLSDSAFETGDVEKVKNLIENQIADNLITKVRERQHLDDAAGFLIRNRGYFKKDQDDPQ
jgi:hypothetical protein